MTSRAKPVGDDVSVDVFRSRSLADAHEPVLERLRQHGGLGLVSVSVLQRFGAHRATDWRIFDETLRRIGEYLRGPGTRAIRQDDRLFEPSLSGNTFVVILEPPRSGRKLSTTDLARVRHRLRSGLRSYLARTVSSESIDAFGLYVGASIVHFDPTVGIDRVLARALDEAVADALREKDRESGRHARHLHRILDRGLVRAVYQPVVDLLRRGVVGYEALTRVGRGHFENVETLFRTAEALDALFSLERLCRRRAIRDAPALEADQLLFLNMEPESCHDADFTSRDFLETLEKAAVAPSQIVLEITEHSRIRSFSRYAAALDAFRAHGYRVAIDDVGSGYSGLHAVAEIAPDFVKVDMGLVRRIHENPIKREIVATIVQFSRNTGIHVIAEGVETVEELDTLVSLGVRWAQGYLFGRPTYPVVQPSWPDIPNRS